MKSMKSYEQSPDHLYRTQPFPRATTNRPCRKRPAAAAGEALLGANAPHEVLGLDILKFVETLTYTLFRPQTTAKFFRTRTGNSWVFMGNVTNKYSQVWVNYNNSRT